MPTYVYIYTITFYVFLVKTNSLINQKANILSYPHLCLYYNGETENIVVYSGSIIFISVIWITTGYKVLKTTILLLSYIYLISRVKYMFFGNFEDFFFIL